VTVLVKVEKVLARECVLAKKEVKHAFLAIHHHKEIVQIAAKKQSWIMHNLKLRNLTNFFSVESKLGLKVQRQEAQEMTSNVKAAIAFVDKKSHVFGHKVPPDTCIGTKMKSENERITTEPTELLSIIDEKMFLAFGAT